MIIFESILTTFKLSAVFEAAEPVVKLGLILNPNHHQAIQLAQIRVTLCRIERSITSKTNHDLPN